MHGSATHGPIDLHCQIGGRKKSSKVGTPNLDQNSILTSVDHLGRYHNLIVLIRLDCRVRNARHLYHLLIWYVNLIISGYPDIKGQCLFACHTHQQHSNRIGYG
jgi:hypothetical protein